MSRNIISFFSENFTVEISTPVEYSTKNWFLDFSKNAKNGHLTAKNVIFQRFRPLSAQYLGFGLKWPIDTLYNLPIINIGHIGRFIKNRKLAIFEQFLLIFHTEIQCRKIKNRKMSQNHVFRLLNNFFYFQNQFNLVWEVKKLI